MTGYTRGIAAVSAVLMGLALAGCSSPGNDEELTIVASTDVYADIASAISGDRASVTAIISGSSQDPHSYEASARDQLALSRADIVIENGGGFDPFIDTLLDGLDAADPLVLTATEIAGHAAAGEEPDHNHDHAAHDHDDADHDHAAGDNEHVWYSVDAMTALAGELAQHLSELDPEGAAEYEANLERFSSATQELAGRESELRRQHEGTTVAVTESAPLPLFEQLGLVNATPTEFSSAIENGTDVAPGVLLEMQRLIESGSLALLAYNEQTSGPETEQILALAEREGVPVVPVAETLPEGVDYPGWMSSLLDEVSAALGTP